MKNRIITGLLIASLWLSVLCTGHLHLFWLVILIICAIGLYEFYTISLSIRESLIKPVAILIGLFPVIGSCTGRPELVQALFIVALFLSALLINTTFENKGDEFISLAKICGGTSFIGLTAAHLVLLMAQPKGMHWLLLLTLIVTASDTGAYFSGTFWGRHKLCPQISPGKTIEGFIGGLVGAMSVTLISGPLLLGNHNYGKLAFLALVLSSLGVIGDLTESIFKRCHKVKDSGSILPGHGGVLDRVDSILAAGPALYYIVIFGLV